MEDIRYIDRTVEGEPFEIFGEEDEPESEEVEESDEPMMAMSM